MELARIKGFTLLELLVVMGIIATLAAILLPVLGHAREQGRRTVCTSNLGQIGKALAVYSNTFSEYLPSHPAWGMPSYRYTLNDQSLYPWTGHQALSRHMALGCGAAEPNPEADLVPGRLNFVPTGLGLLVASSKLSAALLACSSLTGTIQTEYNGAKYEYSNAFPRWLGRHGDVPLVTSDGRPFPHVPADPGTKATVVLGSYSYRNTPFYSRVKPLNAPTDWSYLGDIPSLADPSTGWLAEWALENTHPQVRVQFICPPFKTTRSLGVRAIVSDSFDKVPQSQSLVLRHHGDGVNVAYGDGHVAFIPDDNKQLQGWKDWADPDNFGTDNLTISSHSSQRVWNIFDQQAGVDAPHN